jgi:hypothetical protein
MIASNFLFFKMNKKGFSLSIETVVYILLAILVLVAVLFLFQDQARAFFDKIEMFFGLTSGSVPK